MALIDEIREQPAVVDRLIRSVPGEIAPLVRALRQTGVDHVLIAARGSSDHAGVYGQYALGAIGRLPVGLATPSLFSRYGLTCRAPAGCHSRTCFPSGSRRSWRSFPHNC